jgi:hypothetical protein
MMSGYTIGFFFPRQVEALDQVPKTLMERETPPEPNTPVRDGDSTPLDAFPSSMIFYRYF